MKKTILLLCVLFVMKFPTLALADTILLKTGQKVEGTIIERNKDAVKINFNGVDLSYFWSEIESVNGQKSVQALPKHAGASPVLPATVGVVGGLIIFSLFIGMYVFTALCLQRIAKKTSKEPRWWAWVPIANLFLMCKIAGLSYWWILGMFLGFIPVLGLFISLGFGGFIGYRIARACNKPGWIGVLTVIPLLGLISYGYLAFSE